jgi:hypothetical protein
MQANNKSEKLDKLKEAIQLSEIHCKRMSFAYDKIRTYFPLTIDSYLMFLPEDQSFIDQLIYRFSKLQDSMGGKLFPSILENIGEDVKGVPFIDLLAKLEELHVINSSNDWLLLRETRNIVTHEYPFVVQEIIDGLNLLDIHIQLIVEILQQVKIYIDKRFNLI